MLARFLKNKDLTSRVQKKSFTSKKKLLKIANFGLHHNGQNILVLTALLPLTLRSFKFLFLHRTHAIYGILLFRILIVRVVFKCVAFEMV